MDFIKNIYIGENIKNEDINNIYDFLKRKIPMFNIYCICIKKKSRHILEILKSSELFSNKCENKDYVIVGIAKGRRQALRLTTNIFEDCINKGIDIMEVKQALLNNEI